MNKLEILETKLQTIFMDDDFVITKNTILEKIEDRIYKLMMDIAGYNSALTAADAIAEVYSDGFRDKRNGLLLEDYCSKITELLENEIAPSRLIMLDFFEELLTNQDLYDYMKEATPHLVDLISKINKYDCFDFNEIMECFENDINVVSINELEKLGVYGYLNETFLAFKELLVPIENKKKEFVKCEEKKN